METPGSAGVSACIIVFLQIELLKLGPTLAAKVTVKSGRMARPVRDLMGQGRIVRFRIPERLKGRHLHIVRTNSVISLVAAMPDIGTGRGKERFRAFDPLDWVKLGFGHGVIMLGQALDLFDVKGGVAFHERGYRVLLPCRYRH